jgi:L-alanine-DL-glutamate epimerase-like enolase superfamily enzyme
MLDELPIEMEYAAALPEKPIDYYAPQLEVKDGFVEVPSGPGLGISFARGIYDHLEAVQ